MKRHVWTRLRALLTSPVRNVIHKSRPRRLSLEDLEIRLAPATRIWSGAGVTNNWDEAQNWHGNQIPGNGDDLVFPADVSKLNTFNNIPNATFNLISFSGSGYTLDGLEITLGTASADTGYIIANLGSLNNTINLDITMGGAAGNKQFFTVGTSGANLTINGALKGNTGVELSKDGPGTLILAGDNVQFTGAITIVAGALNARHANALGDTSSPTTVLSTFLSSGQLQIENITGSIQETLRLNGPGAFNDGALLNVAGNNVWAGSIILDTNSIIGANAGSLTIEGVISDSGAGQSLTKEGPATIILDPLNSASGNSYRGQTIINNGILRIRHSLALGNDPVAITNPLLGLVNNTVVASFPNRSGTLQLDFVPNVARIDPFAGVDGFSLPYESLTLNGPGVEGIHVFPKQPMPNGATVTGALNNFRGNNTVVQDVFLWSDNSTVLGDINFWAFGGNVAPTVGIGAEANSTLTFTGHIVDTNLTGTPDYSLIKTRQGRVVFVNANSYRGRTEILQGYLTIRDSQALGSASGTVLDGTWIFPQAALELEADDIPDSQSASYVNPPHGLPHLPTDIIISNEMLRPMGDGFNNSGSIVNVRGVNELTGPFQPQQLIPRGNVNFNDTGASVGVAPDYAPYTLFDRSQLTISGEIQDDPNVGGGSRLTKFGLGELVITNDNSGPAGYFGPTYIREGWITARNSGALGRTISFPNVHPDTVQPATYVAPGAALHLKPTRDVAFQSINVPERLFLTGNGIDHRFPELHQRGALLNLGGNNVYSGIVTLVGTAGFDQIGLGADIDSTDTSVTTSSLRFTNMIQQGVPDQPSGSTGITAVVQPMGIEKLGRKRIILQGPGTFTGNNDIVEGVLRIQNDIALGMVTGTTTVQDGAAIEIQGYTTANNGGLPGGIQVRESLILFGLGNFTADDPTHDFTAPVLVHTVTNRSDDNIWNGSIVLQTDIGLDTQTNSRLALWKQISGPGGFTKYNEGKLILGGNNSYAGTTTVNAGILNLQSPTALGSTIGGTIVANDAQIELQGDITIGGESLTILGNGLNSTPTFPLRWFPQGPGPITDTTWQGGTTTGRINAVAVDPRDSNVMYVGGADGGLWRTKNNGLTWEQLIDNTGGVGGNQILFVGAIQVAPTDSNTLYVALGDSNNRSDSYYGRGILRSTDYGRTWTLIQPPGNLFDRSTISQLVVDPSNPNTIYVAVQGNGINGGAAANYGIWRFQGGTWTNLTAGLLTSTSRFTDLVVFPADGQPNAGNRVIAFATGNIDGSNSPAVYISTDAGATFTTASFPTTPDSGFVDRNGRIKIAGVRLSGTQLRFFAAITYPVNGARAVQGTSGTFRELLTTTATYDPATTLWTVATWGAFGTQPAPQGSAAGYQANQGQFQSVITVNPNNPNYIFLAGFGGTTTTGPLVWNGSAWVDVDPGNDGFGPHNLYYSAAWRPDNTLVVGTAGGIWQMNNNAPPAIGTDANWVNKNGNFLQITQFTGLDVHPFDPFRAVGSAQDNGAELFNDSLYWTHSESTNGSTIFINNKDPNLVYRLLNSGAIRRSTDGGASWATIVGGVSTFTMDRVNPNRLLIGVGSSIRETLNANGAATFVELGNAANNGLGSISLIGLANRQGVWQADPSYPLAVDNGNDAYDPATIYLMTSNGFWVTKNSGQLWVQRNTGLSGPFSEYSAMAVDPRNRDTVYVVRNVFGGAKVLRTTDAGRTWTDISGALPDLPTWSITIDPRNGDVYVGNDNGVYQLPGGSGTWARYGVGLPNVQVRNLVLNTLTNTLTAGTYGRGMFELFLDNSAANSGAIRAISGSSVWAGNINLTGDITIQADPGAQVNFVGSINEANVGDVFNITKTGTGRVVFSGVNSYHGVTDIQQGVLVVRNPFALGDSAPTAHTIVRTGAALELQSDLALERVELNGNGIPFNSRFTGALRSVSNNNTFTGTLVLDDPAAGPSNNAPLPSDTALQITIGVDSDSTLTIGSKAGLPGTGTIIDAAGPRLLTKELTGTLILNSANTYEGLTQINQGTIRAAHNLALGGSTNGTRVRNGAQLELAEDINGSPITITGELLEISGTGLNNTGVIENISGNNIWAGDIILASITALPAPPPTTPPSKVSINVARPADTLTITGVISESNPSFGLDKIGPGRLTLTRNNSYTGTTDIIAGVLRAEATNALGTAGVLPSNGTIVRNGAALELNSVAGITFAPEQVTLNGRGVSPDNDGALRNVGGNNVWTGQVILNSDVPVASVLPGSSVHIGADAGTTLTIDGANLVRDPSTVPVTNKAASLHKVGTGTVVFDDANSYVGATIVEEGILAIRNAGALGPIVNEVQTISINGPGGFFTLTFNGFTTPVPPAQPFPASATAADIQTALNNLPSIGGVGGFVTVTRTGNLLTVEFGGTLAGTNVSQITGVGTGGTSITSSTVQNGGPSAGTTVQNGATLQLQNNIIVTTELLTLNGAGFNNVGALQNASGNNTWSNVITLGSNSHIGVSNGGETLTIDRSIVEASSNLGVTKVGPGTLNYAGGVGTSNTYTGLTQVNEGTLTLNKTGGAVALNGNLTIGDDLTGDATARWLQPNQIVDSATVTVESDGLLDLNGLAETVATLRIIDGDAQTGNGGQITITNLLDMTGGRLNIGSGGRVTLDGNVMGTSSSDTGTALIDGAGDLFLTGTRTFNIDNGPQASDMRIASVINDPLGNDFGITKTGTGTLELDAVNLYTGLTTIQTGVVQVDGQIAAVDLEGGSLSGIGTTGAVNGGTPATPAQGTVSPGISGPGILNTGTSFWGNQTSFVVDLNNAAAAPGVGYDQLRVTGNITLTGSTLVGLVAPTVAIGDSFTIITTTGGNVIGQFAQGTTVFIDGKKFNVVYNATSVVLTRVKANVVMQLQSSTAGNTSVYGQNVTFTVTVTPEPGAGPLSGGSAVFTLDGVFVTPAIGLGTSPGVATMNPLSAFGQVLAVGNHSVLATYSGNDDFNNNFIFLNNGIFAGQQVNKASTTVNATITPTSPVYGQTIVIGGNILPVAPGGEIVASLPPSGSVTYTIDGIVGLPEPLLGSSFAKNLTGLSVGLHTVKIDYSGDARYNSSFTTEFQINIQRASATVGLMSPQGTSATKGDNVTFVATLTATPPGVGIPTGDVFFFDGPVVGGTLIGTGSLVTGITSINTSSLSVGTHTITAYYPGDTNFQQSTGTLIFTINAAGTSTEVAVSPSLPTSFGQTVTFTASVTSVNPLNGVPSGSLRFLVYQGVTLVTTSPDLAVGSLGTVSWPINTLPAGSYTVVAEFLANANFDGSTSAPPTAFTVNPAATSTVVSSTLNPAATGLVTLRATVSVTAPGSGIPTGTVNFFRRVNNVDTYLGAGVLSGGVATLAINFPSQGTYNIVAQYTGAGNYAASPKSPVFQQKIVAFGSKTTLLSPSFSTAVAGQKITYTAAVTNTAGTKPVTAGSVTFFVNGVAQVTVPVNTTTGRAVFTRAFGVGNVTVVARYNGTTQVASSSASKDVTVTQATTQVLLSANRNPSYTNVATIITATIRPDSPSTGVPSGGTVTFFVDGVAQTPVAVTGGKASINLGLLPVGNYNITATYTGNSNFIGNVSTVFSLGVTNPPPASRLTATVLSSVAVGTPFTIRAFARDANNQVVNGYNSPATITLISAPALASFSGNRTVSFNNGVANFTNLRVTRPGRYTFRINSGGLVTTITISVVGRLV